MNKDRVRTDHIHIVIPQYLMQYIEELANKHQTSRSHEIIVSVLLRYLNDASKGVKDDRVATPLLENRL